MSFDFNDHADEAARKDYPNERDCEHGQLRRSCPLCAAEADYADLLARHNALVEAVAKMRYANNKDRWDALEWTEACAEVDRLLNDAADCKGEG